MIKNICDKLNAKVLAGSSHLDKEVKGVYICDLLSWVMAHANKGSAWITVMSHANIIAVASLLDLGCIIIPENIEVDPDALKRADEEGIPIISTALNAFEIAVALEKMGLGI